MEPMNLSEWIGRNVDEVRRFLADPRLTTFRIPYINHERLVQTIVAFDDNDRPIYGQAYDTGSFTFTRAEIEVALTKHGGPEP